MSIIKPVIYKVTDFKVKYCEPCMIDVPADNYDYLPSLCHHCLLREIIDSSDNDTHCFQ